MALITELTLALYVYIISGILVFGCLLVSSMWKSQLLSISRKANAENIQRLRNWRNR